VGQVVPRATQSAGTARREAAARLGAAKRRLFLISTAAGTVVLWLLWASGAAAGLWRTVVALPVDGALALSLYVIVALVVLAVTALPFGWYGGYRLAHRFELSRQTLRAWLADWVKAALLGILFGSLGVLTFYGSLTVAGGAWWLLFGTAATVATVFVTFVAPYLLVPIFYRMRPLQDQEIVEAIRRLAAAAHADVREVCTLDFSRRTAEANAAVIGLGRSRRVVLADTLLSEFTLGEINSVVAHELGHHVHRDVLRLLGGQAAVLWTGLALATLAGEQLLLAAGAIGGMAQPANLPLLLLAAELFGLVAMPLGNALSRRFEAAADRFALYLTGDPTAFASAMRKLADQNLVELQPPRWAELVLASHPPIARRIRVAEAMEHAGTV
jgi:STE24 endopeptidase